MSWGTDAFSSVLGFASSIYSGYTAAESVRDSNTANANVNAEQMRYNSQQAQVNRDFEERMSNSAWQRGVADMRAAGINPIAAYSSGSASVPSGNAASSGSLRGKEPVPSIPAAALATALEIYKVIAAANKDKATTVNVNADTDLKKDRMPGLLAAQEDSYNMEALHKVMLNKMIEADLPGARARSLSEYNRGEVERRHPVAFGRVDAVLKRLGFVGSAAKALGAYMLLKRGIPFAPRWKYGDSTYDK